MNPYTIITGASSGIGYELAHVFAEKKHNLILVARSEEKLRNLQSLLKNQYSVEIEIITVDLCSPLAAQTIFEQIKKLNIVINGLINNAGFGDVNYFHHSSLTHIKDMIQVNVTTLVELCHLLLPQLIKSTYAPFIINVASTGSFTAGPLIAVYYATKAFVLSFTEALSEELKNDSIFVCALCPGSTETGFQEKAHFSLKRKNHKYGLQLFGPASARSVAEYAYKCLESKQVIAIHGFMNRLFIFSTRLLPRAFLRKMMMKAQLKRATHISSS